MYHGTVKWFNETKGFGFISNDEGGDALLPSMCERPFSRSPVIVCDGVHGQDAFRRPCGIRGACLWVGYAAYTVDVGAKARRDPKNA